MSGPGLAGPVWLAQQMGNDLSTTIRNSWLIALALTGWLLWLLAPVLTPFIAAALLAYIGILLALPAAAVLSVLVRFAYDKYLVEHPELSNADDADGGHAGEPTP